MITTCRCTRGPRRESMTRNVLLARLSDESVQGVQLQTVVGQPYGQNNDSLLQYTIFFILPELVRLNKEGSTTLGAILIDVSCEFTFHVYMIRET